MPLIGCRECGKHISTDAASCPQCGAPRLAPAVPGPGGAASNEVPKKPRTWVAVRWWHLLLIAVVTVWVVVISQQQSVPVPSATTALRSQSYWQQAAAIVACEMRVKSGLKAPSTAKFAGRLDTNVRDKGSGIAVVISHVDAQNSFGAILRTRWICDGH